MTKAIEAAARAICAADVGKELVELDRKWIEGDEIKRQPWPEFYTPHAQAAITAYLAAMKAEGWELTKTGGADGSAD